MDGRDATDPTVPEKLQFNNLPNQIEKFMEEEGESTAIVRRVQYNRSNNPREKPLGIKAEVNIRKFLDVKCPLCQAYGHNKGQCDRMAIWLNLKDAFKSVDEKLRAQITTNFAKVDAERRAKKVAKLKGTVRQLYSEGHFKAGDKLLTDYMETLDHHQGPPEEFWVPAGNVEDSDSEQSHAE